MQKVITTILTDPAARTQAAVESSLIKDASVAAPWNGFADSDL